MSAVARPNDSGPRRIQLSRAKGWRKPEGAVVVSRPSRWGNPVTLDSVGGDRAEAVRRYRAWLDHRLPLSQEPPTIDEILTELSGRDLACWCPVDRACHGDVLLELANPSTGPD
jgi:hypothetical protein